ncbi:hypothetical protein ABZ410_08350 [Streptomyces cinnamoneus]|uniref:hypothetical protein n=1 Tax=Streptomyces cinnamoneus TaxID=53446 RepID=UPI0033CA9F23
MRTRRVFKPSRLPNGDIACRTCGEPATWWEDWERYGDPRFCSWPYCDEHAKPDEDDPATTWRPVRRRNR